MEEALSDTQIKAFREAFDIFDKDGGGTIDADEMQDTLAECGIYLDTYEVARIMASVVGKDSDIEFSDFLKFMTSTDRFVAAIQSSQTSLSSGIDVPSSDEAVVLFDALTEFMKKNIL